MDVTGLKDYKLKKLELSLSHKYLFRMSEYKVSKRVINYNNIIVMLM